MFASDREKGLKSHSPITLLHHIPIHHKGATAAELAHVANFNL